MIPLEENIVYKGGIHILKEWENTICYLSKGTDPDYEEYWFENHSKGQVIKLSLTQVIKLKYDFLSYKKYPELYL